MRPTNLIRWGIPGAIAVAGIVLIIIGSGNANSEATAAGITAVGIALIVIFISVYVRMSMASEGDRHKEALARERYARTGSWEESDTVEPDGAPLTEQAGEPADPQGRAPLPAHRPTVGPRSPSRNRFRDRGGHGRPRRPD